MGVNRSVDELGGLGFDSFDSGDGPTWLQSRQKKDLVYFFTVQ